MKFNAPKAKRKLDKLFSNYILTRDNRTCKKCGKTNCKVDCCHIFPREYLSLRYNPNNAITLCAGDHKFKKDSWHKSPVHSFWLLEGLIGQEKIRDLYRQSLCDENYIFNEEQYNIILDSLK